MDSDILDLSFLNNIDPNPLLPDKGVIKFIIKSGEPLAAGQKLPQKGFKAYIKLEGRKIDGTSLDKNKNPNEIRKINLFADKYIEGIHIAVASMTKGEVAWFRIEPKYHFFGGSSSELTFNDDPSAINKIDPLLYKIELLDYKNTTLDSMDFEGRVEKFEESRERGKELFAAKKYEEAHEAYKVSINLLRSFPNVLKDSLNEEQKAKLKFFTTILFSNAAQCKINVKAWFDAMKYCEDGLKASPLDIKLLYRQAMCQVGLCNYDQATKGLLKVLELDPGNLEAKKLIEVCEAKVKEEIVKQKKIYQGIIEKLPDEEKKEDWEKKKKEFLMANKPESPEKKSSHKKITIEELEKGIIIDANDPTNIFTNNDTADINETNNEANEMNEENNE